MAQKQQLNIPGGPIRVPITGIADIGNGHSIGWWRVGSRRLQVSRNGSAMWELTGNGHDIPTKPRDLDLPNAAVRAAFRRHLRRTFEPGACVELKRMSLYSYPRQWWSWDDSETWIWNDDDADDYRRLSAHKAVPWMRAQCRAVGMTSTMEDQ